MKPSALLLVITLFLFATNHAFSANHNDHHPHGDHAHGVQAHGEETFFSQTAAMIAKFYLEKNKASSLEAMDIYRHENRATAALYDFRSAKSIKTQCHARGQVVECNGAVAPDRPVESLAGFIQSSEHGLRELEKVHQRRALPGFEGSNLQRIKIFRTPDALGVFWVNLYWSSGWSNLCTKEAILGGRSNCNQALLFCHLHSHGDHADWDCHHNGNNRFHPKEPQK